MSEARGLTAVSLPDLRALLHVIEEGRLGCPVGRVGLAAVGLGHVAEDVALLQGLDAASARAVLSAAIAEREHRPSPGIDLVWTGPEARVSTSRDTAVVVRQLFSEAERTVLIGGFRFDHGADIFKPLHAAMKDRGVQTTIFLDIDGYADTEAGMDAFAAAAIDEFFKQNWPFGDPKPVIYYDPRTVAPHSRASLHAKCIVIDDRKALVTSANFTDRGQTRNIEAGVLVDDPSLASALSGQWRGLIDSSLVRRAEPST